MMKEEFEALTNFPVMPNEYRDIEAKYTRNLFGNCDKTEFCKLWVENGGIKDVLQARKDGKIELPFVRRYTNTELMNIVVEKAKESGEYEKAGKILDYFLPEKYKVTKLTDYEFDFHAIADFGGSEGIYLDCWLKGDCDSSGNDYCKMGTFKTLNDDLESMKIMAELGGILNFCLSRFVNQNIKCFTPDEGLKQQAMYEAARQLDSYLLSEKYQELLDKGKSGNLTAEESAALQSEIEEIERKLPNRGKYEPTPDREVELEADQGEEM